MPTLSEIFSNGFEEGNFSAWTGVADNGGAPESSVILAAARSGSYGARLRMVTDTSGNDVWIYKTVSNSPKWVRITAYLKVIEGTKYYWTSYLTLKTAAGETIWIGVNDFNCITRRADGSVINSNVGLAQNTWYKLMIEYDQYNNLLSWEIEGVWSGSTDPATSSEITEFQLRTGASQPHPSTCYWDDVKHYDESSAPPPPPPVLPTLTGVYDCH